MTKRRVGTARALDRSDPGLDRTPARGHFPLVGTGAAAGGLEAIVTRPARLREAARQLLADAYVPVSVLVNYKHECLYSFGATDRYLLATAGEPSRDVVAIARLGLRAQLRSALQRAAQDRTLTTVAGAKMILDRTEVEVSICVRPTEIEGEELMLVSFETKRARPPQRVGARKDGNARAVELGDELDATRKALEGAIRDLEIANEDHKATNQDAMSVNETERKQAETALGAAKADAEHANLGKSRFLAAASHDLRQPLQTISLMQGLLLTRVKDESTLELVGKLGDTVGAMSSMLNALLDINELEAGILLPEMVDFPIDELLDGLKAEFGYHAGAKGLDWRGVPCRMRVHSDRKLLEQMVRNLLSNAVKYTEHGKILIGCRQRAERLRLEVWDTGIGIPGDQLQTIFEEFRQLHNSARERSRGLGLGLSVVQRLGGLLGVSIDVRSRPGSGSLFAIEVPLAAGARDAWQAADRPDAAEGTEPRGSLLIIEDDPMLLDLLALLFQDEGHQVAAAGDGRQALALASTGRLRPDVIIADYNLPGGMNGVQAITGLREMLRRDIPAIIMTGDIAQNLAPTNCIQLNKPVKSDDLTGLIQRLLAAPGPTVPAERMPAARLA
jgi:signal transduction histidine kinase/ActR/RegA family two-component response regulator